MGWIDQLQQANWSQAICVGLGAYLLGCFTTGYYLMRMWQGVDIRDLGSGSVGAKNVGRVLGWTGFVVVTVGDVAKGVLAVWAVQHFTQDDHLVAVAMLGVVTGHIWPAQLRFHGGKGVATSLGGLLMYDYHLIGMFFLSFVAAYVILRKTVLPGLFAFACLPLASYWLGGERGRVVALSLLAGLVLISHRRNLSEEFFHFLERRNIHKPS